MNPFFMNAFFETNICKVTLIMFEALIRSSRTKTLRTMYFFLEMVFYILVNGLLLNQYHFVFNHPSLKLF